jgi:CheY-like chemotaxis protein
MAMPIMDGSALINVLRNNSTLAALPVILITGESLAEGVQRSQQITLYSGGGLSVMQVIRCLKLLIKELTPEAQPTLQK